MLNKKETSAPGTPVDISLAPNVYRDEPFLFAKTAEIAEVGLYPQFLMAPMIRKNVPCIIGGDRELVERMIMFLAVALSADEWSWEHDLTGGLNVGLMTNTLTTHWLQDYILRICKRYEMDPSNITGLHLCERSPVPSGIFSEMPEAIVTNLKLDVLIIDGVDWDHLDYMISLCQQHSITLLLVAPRPDNDEDEIFNNGTLGIAELSVYPIQWLYVHECDWTAEVFSASAGMLSSPPVETEEDDSDEDDDSEEAYGEMA
jgi:hypothetical protein